MTLDIDHAARRLAAADPEAFEALLSRLEDPAFCEPCRDTAIGRIKGILEGARMELEGALISGPVR